MILFDFLNDLFAVLATLFGDFIAGIVALLGG